MRYLEGTQLPIIESGDTYNSTSPVIDLSRLAEGMHFVGIVLLTDFVRKLDKTSKRPTTGTVTFKGYTMTVSQFQGAFADLVNYHPIQVPLVLEGEFSVGSYNGNLQLDPKRLIAIRNDVHISNFEKSVDLNAVWSDFLNHLQAHFHPDDYNFFVEFVKAENIVEKLKYSYAGKMMHDAQVGGLINHTLKMLRILEVLLANDPRLKEYERFLRLAVLLHDIGKVHELGVMGLYTPIGFASHRLIGIEMITRHKDKIVALTGDELFFYHLVAVLSGHHGEYADKPTTVWAKIIHLIDMLDAHTTGTLDAVEVNRTTEKNGHKTIYDNGSYLVVW